MKLLKRLILCMFMHLPFAAAADTEVQIMGAPTGDVLLSVKGAHHDIAPNGHAMFDIAMLQALPAETFATSTIWTEGVQEFTGVPLHALIERLGIQNGHIRASAINDYHVEIPLDDAKEGGPIIAYMRNGETMSVRNKGPLWLIYPFDHNEEYRSETIYSRSIWQLDRIEILH